MEDELMEHYYLHIDASGLPDKLKDTLRERAPCTLEELDVAFNDLIHFLTHKAFYTTLDRIENGEQFLAQQTEPAMIAKCRKRLNELAIELEQNRPKEESA